jgi:hypothetical protein
LKQTYFPLSSIPVNVILALFVYVTASLKFVLELHVALPVFMYCIVSIAFVSLIFALTTFHVVHVLFGFVITISGGVVSLHTAVKLVFCVIVTVVGVVVRLAGVFQLFTIHPLNVYQLTVLHVALILTPELYLYVHAPFTLSAPAHVLNVNVCLVLLNQKYVVVSL